MISRKIPRPATGKLISHDEIIFRSFSAIVENMPLP
jgi:hypothetical protein